MKLKHLNQDGRKIAQEIGKLENQIRTEKLSKVKRWLIENKLESLKHSLKEN